MPNDSDIQKHSTSDMTTSNRRKHRRHSSAIDATAYTTPTVRVPVTINNVSYDGLQLTLNLESADQLLQPSTHIDDHQHTRLSIEFSINNQQGQPCEVHILCRIVHIENRGGQCLIGLEHRDIEEGIMVLSEFIMTQTGSG